MTDTARLGTEMYSFTNGTMPQRSCILPGSTVRKLEPQQFCFTSFLYVAFGAEFLKRIAFYLRFLQRSSHVFWNY